MSRALKPNERETLDSLLLVIVGKANGDVAARERVT